MAFTLQIKWDAARSEKRGFLKKKRSENGTKHSASGTLDILSLAKACGFRYGSDDEFYILREGEQNNATAVFYHPDRIGRGIFVDGHKAEEGFLEISYNIPTTRAEIAGFAELAKEIERRLGEVEMYCVEEERYFTGKELEEGVDAFAEFSLRSLNQFCGNKEYERFMLTLALWPYVIPEDKVALWENCTDLADFEETIHCLQSQDVYYAKPQLFRNNATEKIGAFYALTEECTSVFPVHADGFLNMDGIQVDEGFVRFVLYSEQRVLDGLFPYEAFMEALPQYGIQQFDASHVLIPPLSKEELESLAEQLKQ